MGDLAADLAAANARLEALLRLGIEQAKLCRDHERVAHYERRLKALTKEASDGTTN